MIFECKHISHHIKRCWILLSKAATITATTHSTQFNRRNVYVICHFILSKHQPQNRKNSKRNQKKRNEFEQNEGRKKDNRNKRQTSMNYILRRFGFSLPLLFVHYFFLHHAFCFSFFLFDILPNQFESNEIKYTHRISFKVKAGKCEFRIGQKVNTQNVNSGDRIVERKTIEKLLWEIELFFSCCFYEANRCNGETKKLRVCNRGNREIEEDMLASKCQN